ncbi:MAG: exodeoxyribonuclease VII small subunit [Christensenellaceae bacterium]|jgi:exodeoxyribonuclease VII small subunit|nr:exodeoxyribonuclease VII small subunit [Christensenellaceae bacterium]
MPRQTKTEKQKGFEEGLLELERILSSMEGGELPLDAAIAAYEEGAKLALELESQLKAGQAKVEKLMKDKSRVPFGEDGEIEA